MTSNKFIADLKNSRFYRFLRHYVWAERRLWAWTLGTAWLVALVVYVSLPTEYEAHVLTLAEATYVEINDTGGSDAGSYGISKRARDDIRPGTYRHLFRSRPFLMSVLQSPVVRQDAPQDTITLYEYVRDELRYPWWSYVRSGVMWTLRLPIRLLSGGLGGEAQDVEEPDIHRFSVLDTDVSLLTPDEARAAGVLWKRIEMEIESAKRGVTFKLRMQDPRVVAIAVDSLVRRVLDKVEESRAAKLRQDLANQEADKERLYKEYVEAMRAYAEFMDRNQDLATRDARRERVNLNIRMNQAYTAYLQKADLVNKAKENVAMKKPVLTVIQPAEVPLRPVGRGYVFIVWTALAVAGTLAGIWLKRRSYRLPLRRRKRPTLRLRRPRLRVRRRRLSL